MSKITVAGVRTNVQELLKYSTEEKKRNFLETVEVSRLPTIDVRRRLTKINSSKSASRTMIPSVISVSRERSSYQLSHDRTWLSGRLFPSRVSEVYRLKRMATLG